ncbi:hypothetical protein F7725_008247 [Dissostichus mawsoni]|uniref:Uncharacterized protein n=1 Tax=Dissostichus mawsoni TaxID=36200 RepID=A0A7J5Y6M8_DISMA|nr:hypothetical protein F7725_008247 [Dissostichus mawsoni]
MLSQRSSTKSICPRAKSTLGPKLESHPQCLSSIHRQQHNLLLTPQLTPRLSPLQQWTSKLEPQNQPNTQQRHPISPPYPPQMGQIPQSQAYPTIQALPQWPQPGPQQGPQAVSIGFSHMGPSCSYANTATTWPQSQPGESPDCHATTTDLVQHRLKFHLIQCLILSLIPSLKLSNIHKFSIKLSLTLSLRCKLRHLPYHNHNHNIKLIHSLNPSCRPSPKQTSSDSH